MLDVHVKRSEWYRGQPGGYSALLINAPNQKRHGKKCCLGFAAIQGGFPEISIEGCGMLSEVNPEGLKLPENLAELYEINTNDGDDEVDDYLTLSDTEIASKLAIINDRVEIDDATREAQLTELAKAAGINFIFED